MRGRPLVIPAILITLVAVVGGVLFIGARRWHAQTRALRADVIAARANVRSAVYDERELADLPEPVRRYFGSALRSGQPMIASARFDQEGEFLVREEPRRWRPFRATQHVSVSPPAFDWDARIAWAPGMTVFVRDGYAGGAGILHAAAYGLVTMMEMRGTPELAEGELMRFLAEAPWYPTALLPGQGVDWEEIDDSTARARLTDGVVTVSLDFSFGDDGLISGAWSPARYRDVDGTPTPTPWQGRFSRYEVRSGMRMPTYSEVAWVPAGGAVPYWRARLTDAVFELVAQNATRGTAVSGRAPS